MCLKDHGVASNEQIGLDWFLGAICKWEVTCFSTKTLTDKQGPTKRGGNVTSSHLMFFQPYQPQWALFWGMQNCSLHSPPCGQLSRKRQGGQRKVPSWPLKSWRPGAKHRKKHGATHADIDLQMVGSPDLWYFTRETDVTRATERWHPKTGRKRVAGYPFLFGNQTWLENPEICHRGFPWRYPKIWCLKT